MAKGVPTMTEPEPDDGLNLFDTPPPPDVVPTEPQPLDEDTAQRLRDADGSTVHLHVPAYFEDADGRPNGIGWRHEGSGTLHMPSGPPSKGSDDQPP